MSYESPIFHVDIGRFGPSCSGAWVHFLRNDMRRAIHEVLFHLSLLGADSSASREHHPPTKSMGYSLLGHSQMENEGRK
jgi:hypothetical protein